MIECLKIDCQITKNLIIVKSNLSNFNSFSFLHIPRL